MFGAHCVQCPLGSYAVTINGNPLRTVHTECNYSIIFHVPVRPKKGVFQVDVEKKLGREGRGGILFNSIFYFLAIADALREHCHINL